MDDQVNLIDFDEVSLSGAAVGVDLVTPAAPTDSDDDDEIIQIDDEVPADIETVSSSDDVNIPADGNDQPTVRSIAAARPPSRPPVRQATANLPPPQVSTGTEDQISARFNERASLGLGAAEIVIGTACVMLGISTVYIQINYYRPAHQIWGGLLCSLNGIVGILIYRRKTSLRIIFYLIISLISTFSSIAVFTISVVGSVDDRLCEGHEPRFPDCSEYFSNVSLALNLVTCVIAMAILTLCLTSTILSARACCNRTYCLCCFHPPRINNADSEVGGYCFYYRRSNVDAQFAPEGSFRFYDRPPPYSPGDPPPRYSDGLQKLNDD
jgi:multisubunit Na+/H+ antiporter MnhC subunit